MRSQSNSSVVSSSDFERIYEILTQSPEERKSFFVNPEKILAEKGVELDTNNLEVLKKIANLHIDKNRMDFNEKLVLCSSSGY